MYVTAKIGNIYQGKYMAINEDYHLVQFEINMA